MRKALVRLIKSEALKLPHALVGMMVVLTFACAPLRALAQGAGGVVQGVGSAAMRGAKQAGENAAGQMMQNMESAMMSPSAAASPGAAQSSAVSGQSAAAASLPNAPSVPSMTGARLSLQCPTLAPAPNPSATSAVALLGFGCRLILRALISAASCGRRFCASHYVSHVPAPGGRRRARSLPKRTLPAPSLTAAFRSSVA
jgi:hypothetical protein